MLVLEPTMHPIALPVWMDCPGEQTFVIIVIKRLLSQLLGRDNTNSKLL